MHSNVEQCDRAAEASWPTRHPRIVGLSVAAACWAVVAAAAILQPDPRGYDTHTQLHLPACSYMQRTGMPCPTCGMTTAFANMARGHPLAAFSNQPFGPVFFLAVLAGGVVGTTQAATGRSILAACRPRVWWLWVAMGGVVGGWGIKMALGLNSGALPVR